MLSARLIMELHTVQYTDQHSALATSQWHILEKPKAMVFLYMSCEPSSIPVVGPVISLHPPNLTVREAPSPKHL